MASKIPWTRILAEGTVIVVSILLAFGIDAWWQRRGEDERAEDYLTRLHADLAQDTASLAYLLDGLGRKNTALLMLQSIEQRGGGHADLASALLQAEQYGWGQFQFNGTTFDDLRSTGNLRLIVDDELRAALVDYYETWRLEQGRIAVRRSELPAMVYKLLPIEFGIVDSLTATVDENQALDLRELGTVNSGDLRDALSEPLLQRELVHELNYTGFVRTALTRLSEHALRVLLLVERAGAGGGAL